MNAETLKPFIQQALRSALASGTTTLVEEFAEGLNVAQLETLILTLQRVAKKKRGTVDSPRT